MPTTRNITNSTLKKPERVKSHFFFLSIETRFLNFYNPLDIPSTIPDISVNGKELFTTMMAETAILDPNVFLAIQKLKQSKKFKLAALTNNFDLPEDDLKEAESMGSQAAVQLRALFDYFIESRLVGLR